MMRFADFGVDVLDGLQHALAEIARLVAIAQFDRLAAAGGGAGRHGGTAHHAGFQQHVGFDGGIAAGIQNFPGDDINNCTQFLSLVQIHKASARMSIAELHASVRSGQFSSICSQ